MLQVLLSNKWLQPLLLVLCCIGLNLNTFTHEYALDDEMVLVHNIRVHQGFSGILPMLKEDSYKSYYNYVGAENTNLAGGRYRPLSIISFAVEQGVFGKTVGNEFTEHRARLLELEATGSSQDQMEAHAKIVSKLNEELEGNALALAPLRHAMNAVYYALCCLALFYFLRLLFPQYGWLPLLTTLLFVFHPVHTEVVANVKSRDEIFSLLFILLTCSAFLKYFRNPAQKKYLLQGLLFYLLAFLSKEYAFALMALVPFLYYLEHKGNVFAYFGKAWFLVLSGATALFLLIRHGITKGPRIPNTEVLNDPYMYATGSSALATKIATLLEYARILVYPKDLSSDYSFSTFPYLTFSNPKVWLSLVFWGAMAAITVWLVWRKHVLAFPLVWFLVFFMLVNNMLFPIGATMGERLIFHSSVGYCVLAAWGLLWLARKLPLPVSVRGALAGVLLLALLVPYGLKTVARNTDWKNDFTLFTTDVHTVPNSALANSNAGGEYFNYGHKLADRRRTLTANDSVLMKPYIEKGIFYLSRAIAIHPNHINSYINRALCYMFQGKLDLAIADWKAAARLFNGRNPHLVKHAQMLLDKGKIYGNKQAFPEAVRVLEPASVMDPYNPAIWNNLGGAYYMTGNMEQAADAFAKALQINPNLQDARNGYNAAMYNLGKLK